MLVLARKQGEKFRIGEAVVTIVQSGRTVRLGIEAPLSIPIVRREPDAPAGSGADGETLLRRLLRERRERLVG